MGNGCNSVTVLQVTMKQMNTAKKHGNYQWKEGNIKIHVGNEHVF